MACKKPSRRNVLKSVGFGLSASALPLTTSRKIRTTRITTIKSGDTPLERKDVPTDWWSQMQTAKGEVQRLSEKFRNNPAVSDISMSAGEELLSGRRMGIVNVYADSYMEDVLPDVTNGVEVRRREPERQNETLHDCNKNDYPTVRGGVVTRRVTGQRGRVECSVLTARTD